MRGYDNWKCDEYYNYDFDPDLQAEGLEYEIEREEEALLESLIIADAPFHDSIQCVCCKKHFTFNDDFSRNEHVKQWFHISLFDDSYMCSKKCADAYDKASFDEYFEENNDLETQFNKLLGWDKVTA